MNKLAEALGMDPVELRMKNLLDDKTLTTTRTPLPGGVSLTEVTRQCAETAGWEKMDGGWQRPTPNAPPVSDKPREAVRSGVGLAVGFKNVGFSFGYQENCWAKIELRGEEEIERATVYIGSADVGQGAHTVLQQMAAEALGVGLEKVRLEPSDTATSPGSAGSTSASRMTFMAGNAVRETAAAVLECWQDGERPAVAEHTYLAPETTPFDPETGEGLPNFAYGYVAQAVEVAVDVETGELDILRVICADDVGKAINPEQVEGQVEGGVVQAVGWATCENFISEEGHVLTPHLSTYLVPTIADVPERIETIIIEEADPRGPWGARGMGEMPFIPLAPALVAAIHDAIGVWIDEFPLTAERVLHSLQTGGSTAECGLE
jgi:CO/xanthine dehydrogenase Mo-binding subunit